MDSSLYLNENYRRKCFWTQEKETRVNFNPGLNAPDVYMNYTMTWMLHVLLLICYTALKIHLMFCGNFHTNICQLLINTVSQSVYQWKSKFISQQGFQNKLRTAGVPLATWLYVAGHSCHLRSAYHTKMYT